jgi:hypothetical protein
MARIVKMMNATPIRTGTVIIIRLITNLYITDLYFQKAD